MLKKLRIQFTKTAMLAVAVALSLILASINLLSAFSLLRETDNMILLIEQFDGVLPSTETAHTAIPERTFRYTEESPFETRFFIVRVSDETQQYTTELTQIASVSEEEAVTLGRKAVQSNRAKGFMEGYRYHICTENAMTKVIFVDFDESLHRMRSLLLICLLIYLLTLMGTTFLVWRMSTRYAKPIVQSIENQKRFMTEAEHELKTPITIIAATADVLSSEIGENEWLRIIIAQTERMRMQTQSLLTLSRMDEGDFVLQTEPVRMDLLLNREIDHFRPLAEKRRLRVESRIDSIVTIQGQQDLLAELTQILLENAVQYTPDGGKINISLTEHSKTVQFQIANDAIHTQKLQTMRLFERFYRGDASGGSGLGLPIAKAITLRHGGSIEATVTTDGKFSICVMLRACDAEKEA